MKKLVLFIMAVMAFAGMSVAQDVWSSGFFTASSGIQSPAVYKNSTSPIMSVVTMGNVQI